MPAGTTHYLFSKDILENKEINIKDKIKNYSMYYLGSTGPDIYFYNEPLKPRDRINSFGNLIHAKKVMETLNFIYDYSENDEDLRSYYYGFLTHYCLDSKVHPLVNYASTRIMSDKESVSVNHYRIESFFDTLLLQRHKIRKKNNPYAKDTMISDECANKLADMYIALNEKVFQYEISKQEINRMLKSMHMFIRLAYSPRKPVYRLALLAEKMIGRGHFITSIMLYNEDLPMQQDVLNNAHKQFPNLHDPSITYTDSFDDLYEDAKRKYLKIIKDRHDPELYTLNYNGDHYEEN
jgi:hypothetical protein